MRPSSGQLGVLYRCKKALSPDQKRAVVEAMRATHGVSTRHDRKAVDLPESSHRYERRQKADEPMIEALTALVERHPLISF